MRSLRDESYAHQNVRNKKKTGQLKEMTQSPQIGPVTWLIIVKIPMFLLTSWRGTLFLRPLRAPSPKYGFNAMARGSNSERLSESLDSYEIRRVKFAREEWGTRKTPFGRRTNERETLEQD